MIVLVTGPPGSGKSYYSVRKIAEAVEAGKFVATNIDLVPDWADRLARRNVLRWLWPGRRAAVAAAFRQRVYVSGDLEELFRLRLRGAGEGRGVMVLDEAHNWMNSRTWKEDGRGPIVRFFSQHRKLGWDIYAITQDELNIDRQVRTLFEYHVRLKNLRNFKVAGIPVVPCNVFLAIWRWNDAAKSIAKRQAYRLTRVARIYDSMALSHGLEENPDDAIWLPRTAGDA